MAGLTRSSSPLSTKRDLEDCLGLIDQLLTVDIRFSVMAYLGLCQDEPYLWLWQD